jgi:hypothetical protein
MKVQALGLPFLLACRLFAQSDMHMDMPGMNMGNSMSPAGDFLMGLASGTSVNPASWPMPMVSRPLGGWNLNLMAQGFIVDTQQTGPRGTDKLYSTNWAMISAAHQAGSRGALQFDAMLSLEPATITGERYPLLFQTGETAYGRPIVDGQHPHNLFMALGMTYAYKLLDKVTVELAFHPVGDPTLGPVAYPHRASAMELPEAPISHHLQDSTHIADDVLTAGIAYEKFRLEASGFYGSEPGENRWIIQQGPLNSWAARFWYLPSKNWAAQVSTGRLTHPEALEPGDQVRTTASLSYSKPLTGGSWSSSVIWGRNHYTATQQNGNSFLAETVAPFYKLNFVTARFELVDKNELFPGVADAPNARIGEYTGGFTRDIPLFKNVQTGVGANVTFYTLPDDIKAEYGNHPVGGNVYIRIRLRPPAS